MEALYQEAGDTVDRLKDNPGNFSLQTAQAVKTITTTHRHLLSLKLTRGKEE